MARAPLRSVAVDVGGEHLSIVVREFGDALFVSITAKAAHGAVAAAAVDQHRFMMANGDVAGQLRAVELEHLMGARDAKCATVVSRRLAVALAACDEFRPLTLALNVPEPAPDARAAFVEGVVAAAVHVVGATPPQPAPRMPVE